MSWIGIMNGIPIKNPITMVDQGFQLLLVGLRISTLPREMNLPKSYSTLKLSDNLISQFPFAIFDMPWLQRLDLRGNKVLHIPPEVSKLVNLKEIWLDNNQIDEFPQAFLSTTRLQRLWMDSNFVKSISNCRLVNLERFSICKNLLTSFGAILDWRLLSVLLLNDNQITVISPEIRRLQNLKKLHINNNKVELLPDEFTSLYQLEELQMKSNLLKALPQAIGELTNLQTLNLFDNRLTTLPPSLALLTKLESVNIKRNPIESPAPQYLDDWNDTIGYLKDILNGSSLICNSVKLTLVILPSNQINYI